MVRSIYTYFRLVKDLKFGFQLYTRLTRHGLDTYFSCGFLNIAWGKQLSKKRVKLILTARGEAKGKAACKEL